MGFDCGVVCRDGQQQRTDAELRAALGAEPWVQPHQGDPELFCAPAAGLSRGVEHAQKQREGKKL